MLNLILALTTLNTIALCFVGFVYYRKSGIRLVQKPNQELGDFMRDIQIHGYGVTRIDPDSLMRRSPR